MLEEVLDGQNSRKDEEHGGDRVTPSPAREILSNRRGHLLLLRLARLRLLPGVPALDPLSLAGELPCP